MRIQWRQVVTKNNLLFIVFFTVVGLILLQVPFTQLVGSKARFTLFDFFGPIASGFIGTVPGMISVFLMQFLNFLAHGAEVVDAGTIIRFFPMLFAAWAFSSKSKYISLVVPVLAIIAFNLNPTGRSAWQYSLLWLIPMASYFFHQKSLLLRSLGATFTAHAVGGALWVWAFGQTKEFWLGLIPVVLVERALMAIGIAVSYFVFNNVLAWLSKREIVHAQAFISQRYLLKGLRSG